MNALSGFRSAWGRASRAERHRTLRLMFFPYPSPFANFIMYLNIMFHLLIIYGVVGLGVYYGFDELVVRWGNVTVVRFLLILFIGDVLVSATINRVSGAMLRGVYARRAYEFEQHMQRPIEDMMRGHNNKIIPGDAPADPVSATLDYLDMQDKAMRDQEDAIHKAHTEEIDPIKKLLRQLEEQDRNHDDADDRQ
jgi:hypothetical protein